MNPIIFHFAIAQMAPVVFATVLISMVIKQLLPRILMAVGATWVVFKGADIFIGELRQSVQSSTSSLPAELVAWAAYCRVDDALALILSAYSIKMALKGFLFGDLRRLIFTPPGEG